MELKNQILKALGLSEEVKLEYQNKLEDGTIIVSSADELSAGADVSILTEDGTTIPLPVGEYATEDGTGFSVTEDGTVSEIYTEETEEVEAEEVEAEETEEVEAAEGDVAEVVSSATEEIAVAIEEATGDEVTPEVATAAAEIAVAIVEEKIEEVAMNKQLLELTEVLKTELSDLKTRLAEVENTPATNPLNHNKFSSNETIQELSRAEYEKLGSKGRYFYNLSKRK
tara:strand:+ start:4757 stop:5437 length:681 start_codon:yes stop_codon:yes gene_type:complete